MSALSLLRFDRAILCMLLAAPGVPAQTAGNWSQEFDRPGLVGRVFALTSHAGTLYAGGYALWANGSYLGGFTRFDGVEWQEVPGAPDGAVVGALETFGTDLVVAGDFTVAGGQPIRSIARWDGAAWHPFGAGIDGEVFDVAVYQGELVAAGRFTQAGGLPITGIARWNGSQWTALGGSTAGHFSSTVWSLSIGPDGRLYAGGDFDSIGGVPLRGVAAWDGTAWSAVGPAGALLGSVHALEWFQGRLYAGGSIDFQTTSNENVVVFDGTSWLSTGGIPDWSISSTVNALKVFDGALYAGGNFREAAGVTAIGIARFDGASWSATGGVGNSSPFYNSVLALAIHGGALHVGGEIEFAGFETGAANGTVSYSVARFDGAAWDNVGEGLGFDAEVRAAVRWNGGIAAVGRFTQSGTAMSGQIAWFDGSDWRYVGIPNGNVNDCVVYQGDLVVTGEFSQIDGQPFNAIARWNGTSWSSLGSGAGGLSLAVYQGDLYAGGLGGFRRWNGSAWSPVINAGLSYVRKMHVHQDGLLYVGGGATSANARIYSYDGTNLTPLGSGVNDTVEALTSFGGELIAGGSFSIAGGQPANRLARWNGASWSAFPGVTGSLVRSLTVFRGELYAGGDLVAFSGDPADWIARWDGAAWQPLGLGLNGTPFTLVPDDAAGKLYVGGLFTQTDWTGTFGQSTPSYYFGVWRPDPGSAPVSFCFGDGSGTACPCSPGQLPQAAAGNGCPNSINPAGANLSWSGAANLTSDSFVLAGSGMPNSSVLYFQGTTRAAGGAGIVFGDGLRCAGGTLVRLGTAANVLGSSQYPEAGDSPVSVRGAVLPGDVRTYQAWYRNSAAFCAPEGFNLTNGIEATWGP